MLPAEARWLPWLVRWVFLQPCVLWEKSLPEHHVWAGHGGAGRRRFLPLKCDHGASVWPVVWSRMVSFLSLRRRGSPPSLCVLGAHVMVSCVLCIARVTVIQCWLPRSLMFASIVFMRVPPPGFFASSFSLIPSNAGLASSASFHGCLCSRAVSSLLQGFLPSKGEW
jgi:hypothetical protein